MGIEYFISIACAQIAKRDDRIGYSVGRMFCFRLQPTCFLDRIGKVRTDLYVHRLGHRQIADIVQQVAGQVVMLNRCWIAKESCNTTLH